jgi:transglutaminase-like putative cysteine protease
MLAFLLLTSWFQEVASAPSPAGAAAHVLLREESVVVEPNGRQTITTRGVIRILTPAGARYARAGVAYDSGNGQLVEFRAWVQTPGAEPQEIDPREFTDRPLAPGELRSPLRQRQVEAAVESGQLFLYQSTVVAASAFPQVEFEFQGNGLPVRLSRFRLAAPAGWVVQPVLFAASPQRTGNVWELRDLPANPVAPPRLALTLLPSSAGQPRFATWSDVAAWLGQRAESAAQPTPAIIAQAEKLTAGLATPAERIHALGAFVQGLRYVAINENLGQGGGFVPSPAETVLSRGYGDCKDKATLLRALLRAVHIPSWLVAINASNSARVRPEWPSPRVFNHAIVAIETGSGLLYFDPSDPHQTLGQLPASQQGVPALVLRPGATLAATPEQPGSLERRITLQLKQDGRVTGRLLETAHGSAAAARRARLSAGAYDGLLGSSPTLHVIQGQTQDNFPQDGLHLYIQFEQDNPLAAGGGLHIWKPLLPWGDLPANVTVRETVEIELHPRWTVEEMPEPVRSSNFSAAWFLRDGKLVIDRQLRATPGEIAPVEGLPIVLRGLQ